MNREVRSKDLDIIDPDKKIIALEGGIPVRATRLPYGLQYVNDEDIRFLEGAKTALKDGDEVSIIPAIAGGFQGL